MDRNIPQPIKDRSTTHSYGIPPEKRPLPLLPHQHVAGCCLAARTGPSSGILGRVRVLEKTRAGLARRGCGGSRRGGGGVRRSRSHVSGWSGAGGASELISTISEAREG